MDPIINPITVQMTRWEAWAVSRMIAYAMRTAEAGNSDKIAASPVATRIVNILANTNPVTAAITAATRDVSIIQALLEKARLDRESSQLHDPGMTDRLREGFARQALNAEKLADDIEHAGSITLTSDRA